MEQAYTKGVQDSEQMRGKGDPQSIVKKIEICPYFQMVYGQPRINPVEWDTFNSLGLWDTNIWY